MRERASASKQKKKKEKQLKKKCEKAKRFAMSSSDAYARAEASEPEMSACFCVCMCLYGKVFNGFWYLSLFFIYLWFFLSHALFVRFCFVIQLTWVHPRPKNRFPIRFILRKKYEREERARDETT